MDRIGSQGRTYCSSSRKEDQVSEAETHQGALSFGIATSPQHLLRDRPHARVPSRSFPGLDLSALFLQVSRYGRHLFEGTYFQPLMDVL
jgi:hypothetical protein